MVCSNCGSQIDASHGFCMHCGAPVEKNNNAQPQPQPHYQPQPQPVVAEPYNGRQNAYGYNGMSLNALNAKEYINSAGTCKVLSIVALICIFLTQPIDIVGIVCAIVSLSKIKKLPEVNAELLDPQSLYRIQKAERDVETAHKLAKAAIIIEIIWVSFSVIAVIGSAILAAMGVALPFLPFITDFIETIFM